jgi:hypothetical protein
MEYRFIPRKMIIVSSFGIQGLWIEKVAQFFRINSLLTVIFRLLLLLMRFSALLFALIMFLFSCKKDESGQAGNEIKGSVSLYVTAKHHTWSVPGLTVFMKRNATEFPGTDTSLYEWRTVTDASGMILISELFYGKYFLYATGYDSLFGVTVHGYLPVELNSSSVENDEVYADMAVNE